MLRALDDAIGCPFLHPWCSATGARGKNAIHRLDGLFRQAVYEWLADYEDVNGANLHVSIQSGGKFRADAQ